MLNASYDKAYDLSVLGRAYVEYRTISDDDLLRMFIMNKSKLMPNGCWEWQGANTRGYGTLMRNRRRHYVHHLSCELWKGQKLRVGQVMRHDCDNPRCVNPNHLSPGTQAENLRDMTIRGRHGRRKLTVADVIAIRASVEPSNVLAERLGLGIMAIRRARGGQTWKHVSGKMTEGRGKGFHDDGRPTHAKLSIEQVLAIKGSSESTAVVATRHGVDRKTVYNIRAGIAWRHVTAPQEIGG